MPLTGRMPLKYIHVPPRLPQRRALSYLEDGLTQVQRRGYVVSRLVLETVSRQ